MNDELISEISGNDSSFKLPSCQNNNSSVKNTICRQKISSGRLQSSDTSFDFDLVEQHRAINQNKRLFKFKKKIHTFTKIFSKVLCVKMYLDFVDVTIKLT